MAGELWKSDVLRHARLDLVLKIVMAFATVSKYAPTSHTVSEIYDVADALTGLDAS
jgi:hypothetical protein